MASIDKIKTSYEIIPVNNGFILRPTSESFRAVASEQETFVFETAKSMGEFIEHKFQPLTQTEVE